MKSSLVRIAALAATAALVLAPSACTSEDDGGSSESAATTAGGSAGGTTAEPVPTGPFGPACADVPADGAGSFAGMSQNPFVPAATSQPALSQLVGAVMVADLVDTLSVTSDLTVLAPVNAAFDALPAGELPAALADTARLTRLLTHHVIAGRLGPGELAGTHTTLAGDQVTVTGSGEAFTVAETLSGAPATVVCGNVATANATVYLVDQVLAPAE